MDSSDDELERLYQSYNNKNKNNTNNNKNKKLKNNNKKNKNTTSSYDDVSDSDEVAVQCAILSSFRENDTKQKRPVHSPTLIPLAFPLYTNTEYGSTSSPPTCVVCLDVIPAGTPGIDFSPCRHVSCQGCLSRYVGEQVNNDVRQVACPGKKCTTVLGKRFIDHILPDEVHQRWYMAWIEGSVLGCTMLITCPLEGCGRQIVDDERRYWIRACTCCWRLFCCKCMSVYHMGMTCDQFKKREAEALRRRMLVIRRREEEERERKRMRWCKDNNHVSEKDKEKEMEEEIWQILSTLAPHLPDFGNGRKLIIFNTLPSDTE